MKTPLFVVVAAFLATADHALTAGAAAGGFVAKGQYVGGFTEHNDLLGLSKEEQETYSKAVNKAVNLMNQNQKDNSAGSIKFERLVSVATQVVSGMRYKMTMELTKNGKVVECHVMVTDLYPWINGGTWSVQASSPDDPCADVAPVESGETGPEKRNTQLLGGEEAVDDAEQDTVRKAAQFAVDHINKMSNSFYLQALKEITSVKKQVVNGFLFHIRLTMVPTACRKNTDSIGKTLADCSESNQAGQAQSCDVSVVDMRGKLSMKDDFKCTPLVKDVDSSNVLIGGDGHDLKPHERLVIGGGKHDYMPHGTSNLIGGDDHDRKPHGNVIGGGDHDYRPHSGSRQLMELGVHDQSLGQVNHLIGGGNHDYLHHGESSNKIGGDDHDYVPHVKPRGLIGGGDHDYLPHGLMSMLIKGGKDPARRASSLVQHMSIHSGQNVPKVSSKCLKYLPEFKTFKSTHRKLYAEPQEEYYRFQVFCDNMKKVEDYQKLEMGSAQYGATKFADLTEEEFKKQYMGFRPSIQTSKLPQAEIPQDDIPESWDWRDHGAVTQVKNQGSCGSCWAFSTTGNIEGQYALKHKSLVSLSEQELVDCDKVDEGCNGGLPSNAYEALMKLGGIEKESDYKYEAEDMKCKFNKSEVAVKLSGAVNISQNEADMAAWLYKNGPISIGINAFAMQFYFGGIAHPWKIFCNPKSLDHGVLIVGYGKQGNEPYWIVKNSWGPSWGRDGYYYVYRGDGTCGLNTMCTSATVV